jgi:hypothetical protein
VILFAIRIGSKRTLSSHPSFSPRRPLAGHDAIFLFGGRAPDELLEISGCEPTASLKYAYLQRQASEVR